MVQDITKVLKLKNCQPKIISIENNFFKWEQSKDFSATLKAERIHSQQTCITITVKQSSSGRGNVTPDRNLDLHQDSADFFCKGPDITYFWLCGSDNLCHNYSTLPLKHKINHRQYINKWLDKCTYQSVNCPMLS